MGKEWIKILESTEVHKVELVKAILAEHEIQAVSLNKKDSSYLSFGVIELYVSSTDALRAIKLIQTNEL